jgi:hypothetical protein
VPQSEKIGEIFLKADRELKKGVTKPLLASVLHKVILFLKLK